MLSFIEAVVEESVEKSDAGSSWYVEPLNALVAALIGTVVTLGVNAWWRHRNRAQPDWHLTLSGEMHPSTDLRWGIRRGYTFRGSISNVGDGVAHRVSLKVVGANQINFADRKAQGGIAPLMMLGSTETFSHALESANWDELEFLVEWTSPPTHLGKNCHHRFKVKDFMEQPGYEYTDPETGEVSMVYLEDS